MLLDEMTESELAIYYLNKELALLKIENADLKHQLKKYQIVAAREFESALNQDDLFKITKGLLLDESGQYRIKTLGKIMSEPL